jgi:hypothetical protein
MTRVPLASAAASEYRLVNYPFDHENSGARFRLVRLPLDVLHVQLGESRLPEGMNPRNVA